MKGINYKRGLSYIECSIIIAVRVLVITILVLHSKRYGRYKHKFNLIQIWFDCRLGIKLQSSTAGYHSQRKSATTHTVTNILILPH